MHEDNSQLLAQLQDIHTMGDPGWWPPAPGWWLLTLLLSLAVFFGVRLTGRKLVAHKRRVKLLAALDALDRDFDPVQDAHEYLSGLNRLFRAVALKAFPGTACASMQGEEWVRFIVSLLPEKSESTSLAALARGPYDPGPEFDAGALNQHARTWVRLYG